MTYVYSYTSPLGKILIESDGEFLTGLWFENSPNSGKHSENADYAEARIPIISETSHWLDIYFSGKNPDFTPKFKIMNLTPFRKQVVDEMCQIPYGTTTTYGEIAKKIAAKNERVKISAQAVGGAVGWNPICIIIPCHRVVGANGNLTGYGGGIGNKIALLKTEGIDAEKFALPKSRKFM